MRNANRTQALAGFSAGRRASIVVSAEENDVNININADVDGEQNGGVEAPAVDADAVPLDTSDTPEALELDAADAGADVEDTAEEVVELDNTSQALESIYFALESINTNNQEFTPAAAALLHVAVNNAAGRYGVSAESLEMPSMEDVEVAPISSLETSMEAVGESIKAVAAGVVTFLKELLQKIATFVKTIFSATEAAKVKNEQVIKALADAKGIKDTITVPGILKGELSVAGINAVSKFIDAITGTKFADIEATLRGEAVTKEQVATRFTEMYRGVRGGIPGQASVTINSEGYPEINYSEAEAKEIKTPYLSELQAAAKANQALIAKIVAYKQAEGVRKKTTELLIKLAGENAGEDAKFTERFTARRAAAKLWSKRIGFESKAIGKALAYANAVNNALASAIDKKAAKEAK